MNDMEQAHHELDLLQAIITRHESHMFALRSWLLAIVGGLLAAYYTANIAMSELVLGFALLVISVLFFVLESRHVNLIESVVARVGDIEKQIASSREQAFQATDGWYKGPMIGKACRDGASRIWPKKGMTFVLNLPFYLVVLVILVLTTVSLPPKQATESPSTPCAASSQPLGGTSL